MFGTLVSNDFFTLLIVACLVLIAFAKGLYAKRFQDFIALLINSRYSKVYLKEQRFLDGFDGLLFGNLIISTTITFFLFLPSKFDIAIISPFLFFKYAFLIGAFVLIKVLAERLLASVLSIDSIINEFLFHKISYRNFIGLLLLIVNIILIYTIKPSNISLIIIGILIVVPFIFGLFLFIKSNLNLFKKSFFYFILYLCALEISPYLILYFLITTF